MTNKRVFLAIFMFSCFFATQIIKAQSRILIDKIKIEPKYLSLENSASPDEKQKISQLRAKGVTEKWTFQVGVTSVSKYRISEITGGVPPTAQTSPANGQANIAPPVGSIGNASSSSFDLRAFNLVTPIRDQSNCGSCWAFCAVASLETAHLLKNKLNPNTLDLSEQQILSCSGGGNCGGGQPSKVWDYVKNKSCVNESSYPYQAMDKACPALTPTDFRIDSWGWVGSNYTTPTRQEIKNALVKYGTVSTYVWVNQAFQRYQGGVINSNDRTGDGGWHCIQIIGWNDNVGVWLIKNSWGSQTWGEGGFGWVDYDVLDIGKWATWAVANSLPSTIRKDANITSVSTVRGGVSLFSIGEDGSAWSTYFDPRVANPKWSGWFSLGGKLRAGSDITAVSTVDGGVSLFAIGQDDAVWSNFYDPRVANPKWSGWFSLGAKVRAGANISAVSAAQGSVSLFVVGMDGAVWSKYFDARIPNAKWSEWFSLGAKVRVGSNVTAVSTVQGGISLFTVGLDDAVYSAYFDPRIANAKWSEWFSLGGKVRFGANVSAVSATQGSVSLFVVGMDGGVWSKYFDARIANAKWSDWFSLGAKIQTGTSITAVSTVEGGISLFAVGLDNAVYSAYFDPRIPNAKWSDWFSLGGKTRNLANISAVSTNTGSVSLFTVGTDNFTYSKYFDARIANAKWSEWFKL